MNQESDSRGKPSYHELEEQIDLLNSKIINILSYQQSLEKKENIYQEVLDAVPAFIFWKDRNNNILGFNKAYQQAVNISTEDLLSKTGFELFPDAEKYWIDDLEVIETGVPKLNIIEEVIIPPSQTIWFKTDKVPLRNEMGEIFGVIGVSINITELKNTQDKLFSVNQDLLTAQGELKLLNEELDTKVKQRTAELQQANKNLRRVNLDLDNFVYISSHDLRHPIVNMEGILDLLLNDDISKDKERTLIKLLSTSVTKLKKTVDELSDIAKVQQSVDEECEKINLQDLLDEVLFSLSDLTNQYPPVRIKTDFKQCPHIKFSRKNLRSIFYNLISNSIKYQSEKKDSYISICSLSLNDHYFIEFEDNGIGIKKEHHDRIFKMFQRLHKDSPGSGLGLYIVKRIVDNYEGKIILKSNPGEKTTFEIFLPTSSAVSK
jgi:PAS domain S-box-containing protein